MKTNQIHIRDPFILPYNGIYYMYGTPGQYAWDGANGFYCYISRDMQNWNGPYIAFDPDENFWADRNFWAPEVHSYNGAFYMFASFYSENHVRAVQILRSDTPIGPFKVWSDLITPEDEMCLDGTLYVDREGNPWMVYCHEWLQIGVGTICAVRLKYNLTASEGKPIKLFSADDAAWVKPFDDNGRKAAITDGPFLFENEHGKLIMLWSSISETGYAVGAAVSDSGSITGPWHHRDAPVFSDDGGHCMLFKSFSGENYMCLHRPNVTPDERPVFIKTPPDFFLFD